MSDIIQYRINTVNHKFKKYINRFYDDSKNHCSGVYDKPSKSKQEFSKTATYIPIPYSSQNVVVNNFDGKDTKKNTESENINTGQVILAGTLLTSAIVASTYVISYDPYVAFVMSSIDDDINKIKDLLNEEQTTVFNNFKDSYDLWKDAFINKNIHLFYNKLAISGSLVGLIVGSFIKSTAIAIGGTAGIGIGCSYLAWTYFMGKFNKNDDSCLYTSMISKLNLLNTNFN